MRFFTFKMFSSEKDDFDLHKKNDFDLPNASNARTLSDKILKQIQYDDEIQNEKVSLKNYKKCIKEIKKACKKGGKNIRYEQYFSEKYARLLRECGYSVHNVSSNSGIFLFYEINW